MSQLGTSASGAVGIIFSAMAIIQALSFTIGMGSGNYMARCLGAGRHEDGERAVSVAFLPASSWVPAWAFSACSTLTRL